MNKKGLLRSLLRLWFCVPVLLGILTGCQQPAAEPQFLLAKTFTDLRIGESVSVTFQPGKEQTYLVVVSGHELEFESQIMDPQGGSLGSTRTPYVRLAPHYLVVDNKVAPQTLRIEASPIHSTRNSSLQIRLFQLSDLSEADKGLARAYKLYSNAIQTTLDESAGIWRARVEQLQAAADLFASSGKERERMWAETLAVYFTYASSLSENKSVSSKSRKLYEEAIALGYLQIALMNLHTEGQMLIERDKDDSLQESKTKHLNAQKSFKAAVSLASELNLDFEKLWAINNRGIGYFYQGLYDDALAQYASALELATDLEDDFLRGLVQGNTALALEKKGDILGGLQTLKELNQFFRKSGDVKQLGYNLTELGRVHRRLYQFPEAVEVLSEALQLAKGINDLESEGLNYHWLAYAYFSMGYQVRAQNAANEAIERMMASNNGRGLRDAYQIAADIARQLGEFETMQSQRQRQGEQLVSDLDQAKHYYHQGLDALAVGAGGQDDAFRHFSEAYRRNTNLENPGLQRLSHLRMCSVAPGKTQLGICSLEALQSEYEILASSSSPREKIEAMQIWSEILVRHNDVNKALSVMEDMITQIRFYRIRLPGFLGAWYWESRAKIFDSYLGLVIARDIENGDATRSLLAMDWLRNIDMASAATGVAGGIPETQQQSANQLRALLASRDNLKDDSAIQQVELEIDKLLLAQERVVGVKQELDSDWIAKVRANLPANAAILTYHFSPDSVWAWVLDRTGIQLHAIEEPAEIIALINSTRDGFRTVGFQKLESNLEVLGRAFIQSLPLKLPRNIFLLPSGPLNGFPFDTLRVDDRYLIEDHVLVNLMSLRGIESLPADLAYQVEFKDIFLAGNPLTAEDNLPALPTAADELANVEDRFPEARVSKVEGSDLTMATFRSDALTSADLVHIASHARIDLVYPELSRLTLSSGKFHEEFFSPHDLANLQLSASLVVLSACETVGDNRFQFDNNLGFVSGFLKSGAAAVVASLWPVSDRGALQWSDNFYQQIATGHTAAMALARTKRQMVNAAERDSGTDHWSTFQIFMQ